MYAKEEKKGGEGGRLEEGPTLLNKKALSVCTCVLLFFCVCICEYVSICAGCV